MKSEITHLRDLFGHQRLREKKYTAGQIDTAWSAPIEADFTGWLVGFCSSVGRRE